MAVYVFFGILFLGGFLSLSIYGYLKKKEQETVDPTTVAPTITIWGTLDGKYLRPIIKQLNSNKSPERAYGSLSYHEKNPNTFRDEYIRATARGRSPDLLLIDHPTLFTLGDTIRLIPFSDFPRRQYQEFFIPAAELLVHQNGYAAFPFLADTMVLYYNENLRLLAGIKEIPTTWSAFSNDFYTNLAKQYRSTDRSIIPFGAYSNYQNSVDLVSALFLQAKESGKLQAKESIKRSGRRVTPEKVSSLEGEFYTQSAREALDFYTRFANPRSSVYGWNVANKPARDLFIADDLIFYPGFVSEYQELRRANPNVVIRAAPLPQINPEGIPVTPAILYTLAIPFATSYPNLPPESDPPLAVIYDLLGIFQDKMNDFSALFPIPPAVQGYYPDESATAVMATFIESLFPARAVPLLPSRRQQVTTTLQRVIVGSQSVSDGAATLQQLYR